MRLTERTPTRTSTLGKPGAVVLNPMVASCDACAHMLILRVPEDLDPKMILQVPKSEDKMPVYKGMPACQQDFR